MINNAGRCRSYYLSASRSANARMVDVNSKGCLRHRSGAAIYAAIYEVAENMRRQKTGHIIEISPLAGHEVGPRGLRGDQACRAALSEGPRQEVKPYNICMTVSPGAAVTDLPN